MKIKLGVYLTAMALVGLGVAMAVTNPAPSSYNQYAARRLSQYLQEKECIKLDDSFRDLCKILEREEGQKLLTRLIAQNTQRQNYFLVSIYKTDFSTRELLPSFLNNILSLPEVAYHTETVGLFSNFQTYRVEEE